MQLANKATFLKKDGNSRTMIFYYIEQLPTQLITEKIKGTGTQRNLKGGSRVVYDLEARDFRIFNETTIIGEIEQISLDSVFKEGYIL